jgi:hypothetical protein
MGLRSRNSVAAALKVDESRLRWNEGEGQILPKWGDVSGNRYFAVVEVWQALRNAGWTNVRVRRALDTIRSNNFIAGSREAWERMWSYHFEAMADHWPNLSEVSRAKWVDTFGVPPSEMTLQMIRDRLPSPFEESER